MISFKRGRFSLLENLEKVFDLALFHTSSRITGVSLSKFNSLMKLRISMRFLSEYLSPLPNKLTFIPFLSNSENICSASSLVFANMDVEPNIPWFISLLTVGTIKLLSWYSTTVTLPFSFETAEIGVLLRRSSIFVTKSLLNSTTLLLLL